VNESAGALPTVGTALDRAASRLRRAGIETARLDARLLLAEALECQVEAIVAWPELVLSPRECNAVEALVSRRERREPLAQILGRREFWSLPFTTSPSTLTPRPDSETVIEAALALIPDRARALRILDLGTGTGCLLLALLSEYAQATGVGTDISIDCVQVAAANAAALSLSGRARFVVANWDDGLTGEFDLIVSNPPYIPEGEIESLEPEVRTYGPRLALTGGADGLAAYRALMPRLSSRLTRSGVAVFEVGVNQAESVESLAREAGLEPLRRFRDLGGVDRCVAVGVNSAIRGKN
jgi:release factor glutamine methyltransferase